MCPLMIIGNIIRDTIMMDMETVIGKLHPGKKIQKNLPVVLKKKMNFF